ncbi:MAG: 50S ribosomal protein L25/general stress protein Ctc [Gemmatimonadaceae bacterium]
MATATLNATVRSSSGKGAARKLRAQMRIPAIIYGHGRAPQALAIETRELERLLDRIAAETTVVELSVDGTVSRTLIREIQRHPVRPHILHIDFQELVAGELVTVDLPIVVVGIPAGVRQDGGVLDQVMREIAIEVDPAHMPNHVEVDVSELGLNDSLRVSDLKLPEGVRVLDELDRTICVVSPPRIVEEEPAAPVEGEEAAAEPELIRKPKGEDEEEGEES